jgi:NAD(P)-dependent dehydrogenase (short-subunit alcohol dehydrogenase family)
VRGNETGRLEGKHAIVTGAAQGIGRAIASVFVDEGAQVILCDRVEEEGRDVARQMGPAAVFLFA